VEEALQRASGGGSSNPGILTNFFPQPGLCGRGLEKGIRSRRKTSSPGASGEGAESLVYIPRGHRGPSRLVGVQMVELSDEPRSQDVTSRDPLSFLWSISFPVNKVLYTPLPQWWDHSRRGMV